jgi:hypothetical protein
MTQLVLWMIMAYGLSNIVVYGSIFSGPREWIADMANHYYTPLVSIGKFLQGMTSCMMCFGFHVGWFLALTIYSPVHELLGVNPYTSWFFDAFLSSGAVWAINSIIEWFEQNRPNNNQIL